MDESRPVSSVEQEMKRQPWEPAGVMSMDNIKNNYGDVENIDGMGGELDLKVGKSLRKTSIPKDK